MLDLIALSLVLLLFVAFSKEILSAIILTITFVVVLFGCYFIVDRVVDYDLDNRMYIPTEFNELADALEPKPLEYELEDIE